jgi:hypothetical protein
MKPVQFNIHNLPPWLRYHEKFIIVTALIPAHLKGQAAKKYYDFMAEYEMNDLYQNGVDGVRVMMYGTSLDAPGRRELLEMQSCTAFFPCPHCVHNWQPGARRPVYGGYRRFLSAGHPWRSRIFTFQGERYEFRDEELRAPPAKRTDAMVRAMLARARRTRPCCGHKAEPFLSNWRGADWDRSMCDMMHDLKCFADMAIKGFVGKGSDGM